MADRGMADRPSLADASRDSMRGILTGGKRKAPEPSSAPAVQNQRAWQPSASDAAAFVSTMEEGRPAVSHAAWLRRLEESEPAGEEWQDEGAEDEAAEGMEEEDDEDIWEDAVAAGDNVLPAGAGAVDVEIPVEEPEPEMIDAEEEGTPTPASHSGATTDEFLRSWAKGRLQREGARFS